MKRLLAALTAVLLLLSAAPWALARETDENALLSITIRGKTYRMGVSSAADIAADGWTCETERDGTFSFYNPEMESYFYARTRGNGADDPLVFLNLMWADGVPVSYCGYPLNEDTPAEDGLAGSFWDFMDETLGAKEDEDGTLVARVKLKNGGALEIATKDAGVELTLTGPLPQPEAQMAEQAQALRRTVRDPEQHIALSIPAQYLAFYKADLGITVSAGIGQTTAYIRVRAMPEDPAFSEEAYFEDTLLPSLRALYVTKYDNRLLDEGVTRAYRMAGRDMTGRMYTVRVAKKENCGLVLLDRWEGRVMRYEAYFPKDDPDEGLGMLADAIRSVTGSAPVPEAARQTLSRVDCPQQKFFFSAQAAYPWKYDAQNGVTVYTKKQGVIPYVMVFQSGNRIVEGYEYLKEQYTPHVKTQYGEDFVSCSEYERFLIGGKSLPAARYTYRVQGKTVHMLRVMDSTGRRTVVYTAKFLDGEGADTMAALDAAVSTFQSTAGKK